MKPLATAHLVVCLSSIILASAVAEKAVAQDVFHTLRNFGSTPSSAGLPSGGLVEGTNGSLYGLASAGGSSGDGVLYRVNKDGTGLNIIKSFGGPLDGSGPSGTLLTSSDGMLYGKTMSGGTSNLGTVFRLSQDGSSYAVLKSFQGSSEDGAAPVGDLIRDNNGRIYGATQSGGTSNLGTLFAINPDGSSYAVLHNFEGLSGDGARPAAGLLLAVDGALYGTTWSGGTANHGTIFTINTDGTGFKVLRSFTSSGGDGTMPAAALIQDPDKTLYGTTYQGGTAGRGTVFKINPDGTGYHVLKNLGGSSGSNPESTLAMGTNGVLYGSTIYVGTALGGTLFQMNTDGTGFRVLKTYSGTGTDGGLALGPLLQASDGMLYGATESGGSFSLGSMFQMSPSGAAYTVLVNFTDTGGDGLNPHAPLIAGGDGFLYGTTEQGGTNSQGTVFKVSKDGSQYTVLKNFVGNGDGANPVAGLVQGTDGALYGTTSWDHESGGIATGNGTVFKLNSDGSGFQVLRHFSGGSDGANPLYGSLTRATDGMLYGTTMNGGANSFGTVFRLNEDGSGYGVIKKFSAATEGYHPYGGLLQATDGALYGTTSSGGAASSQGTIFKLNLDGTGFAVLHTFSGSDGGVSYAGLIQGRDGLLYGTAAYGGSNGNGTVFRLNTDGTGYKVLKNLDVNSGVTPLGPLIQGANGVLYGTTSFRGNPDILLGAGTLFQLNTDGSGFRVLKVFTQTGEGDAPHAGLLQTADGTLYGTDWSGGLGGNLAGTLFTLVPAALVSTTTTAQGLEVQVSGLAGRTYKVQRSTVSPQGWTDLGMVTIDANGTARIIDPAPPALNAFYRTVQ